MREGEELFNIDLENFPRSIIETMQFKLNNSREIAEQKLLKILWEIHSVKTNTAKSWVSDIKFAKIATFFTVIPDTSFLVLNIGEGNNLDFWRSKLKISPNASIPDNIRKIMEAPIHIKSDRKSFMVIFSQLHFGNTLKKKYKMKFENK